MFTTLLLTALVLALMRRKYNDPNINLHIHMHHCTYSVRQDRGIITMNITTDIAVMQQAYIECALWSSTDIDCDPLDDWATIDNIEPHTLADMKQDCQDFYNDMGPELEKASDNYMQHGHDFWLTRNGHGAGFWDRGYSNGDILTDACAPYGTHDLIGDYETGTVE